MSHALVNLELLSKRQATIFALLPFPKNPESRVRNHPTNIQSFDANHRPEASAHPAQICLKEFESSGGRFICDR
jgi:hypothetical protein